MTLYIVYIVVYMTLYILDTIFINPL